MPQFKNLYMSAHQIMVLIWIALVIFLLAAPGAFLLFKKAGVPAWKGLVPFYNTIVMLQICHRRIYWAILQLIPVAGWFITLGIYIEFTKVFGKYRFYQHALAALTCGLYFIFLGLDPKTKYVTPGSVPRYKKSTAREWADAGVFAIVAATLIRTFVFEAYTIPTGSMEKTLLVNDFLFVSKFSYGPRIPNTPISFPFVHNTMPIINTKSYVEWIKIPYTRWFARPVHRGDVVVFNFPAGDTVINLPQYQSQYPYYDVCRFEAGHGNIDSGRAVVLADPDDYPLIIRPVDKEENYIKRCVGIPGDLLQIKNQVVYINGKAMNLPLESETPYKVVTNGQNPDETLMKEEYDVDVNNNDEFSPDGPPNQYTMLLTWKAHQKMLSDHFARSITPVIDSVHEVFPYDPPLNWTKDNYGPLWIPKKDSTIPLTLENYPMYERVIRVYEDNKLEIKDGKIFLNDQPADHYTFKMNYYWMMGDNRHGSQDSRYWGFVPEDHVVGEAWLIWMSWNKGVRWSRLFKRIR